MGERDAWRGWRWMRGGMRWREWMRCELRGRVCVLCLSAYDRLSHMKILHVLRHEKILKLQRYTHTVHGVPHLSSLVTYTYTHTHTHAAFTRAHTQTHAHCVGVFLGLVHFATLCCCGTDSASIARFALSHARWFTPHTKEGRRHRCMQAHLFTRR